MSGITVWLLMAGAVLAPAGCAAAQPPATVAAGADDDGYFAVVMVCDDARTFTEVAFDAVGEPTASVTWIGRSVSPITFYRLDSDPPANWVMASDSGELEGQTRYAVTASSPDLRVSGPTVTLTDLEGLAPGDVITSDGQVEDISSFLDEGCR
ncbi:MAG: hypothetical protein ACK5KU_08515 [Beutenbergiaceae bacterium]